jgi:hypothetical protein
VERDRRCRGGARFGVDREGRGGQWWTIRFPDHVICCRYELQVGSGPGLKTEPGPECERAGLAPVAHAELGEDVADVELDGAGADEELVGDLLVGEALAEQRQNFALARGQLAKSRDRRRLRRVPREM